MRKWEVFQDLSYYHMWAVRPIGDRDFNSPHLFHFNKKEDADKFKELVEKAITSKPKNDKLDPALVEKYKTLQEEVLRGLKQTNAHLECQRLMWDYFKGDLAKIGRWFEAPNLLLGGISPTEMIKASRAEKLLKFIKSQLEGNHP